MKLSPIYKTHHNTDTIINRNTNFINIRAKLVNIDKAAYNNYNNITTGNDWFYDILEQQHNILVATNRIGLDNNIIYKRYFDKIEFKFKLVKNNCCDKYNNLCNIQDILGKYCNMTVKIDQVKYQTENKEIIQLIVYAYKIQCINSK